MQNYELFFMGIVLMAIGVLGHAMIDSYRYYLNQKHRFRFFALRDDLTMLVMSGKIDQNDREFIVLRDCLNCAINVTGDLSIREHFGALIAVNQDGSERCEVGVPIHFSSDETRTIAARYYENMIAIVSKNSWFEIYLVGAIVYCLMAIGAAKSSVDKLVNSSLSASFRTVHQLEKSRDSILRI